MELTKYEHACFTVEKDGKSLVVDPGSFTTDLTIPENVVAVIITHDHSDHFSEEQIAEIITKNPNALIIGPREVTKQLSGYETRTVHGGDSFALEGFDLDFYGDNHAVIHRDMPVVQNVGVLIEDRLYYPGDSFTMPEKSVDTLALPIAAPWLKIEDAIEFMKSVGARLTFPTHDAILSITGKQVADSIVKAFTEVAGTEYKRIDGQTIEIQ
ncbi:MAG TPA: MBL fold metallo-hydrolase [Candidatus Microsaccharimonas sp.]|jgi:L-ascorbate metabolism protein UlaG (beta-lactamase superfamily)